jgi:glycerol kinase
MAKYVMALDAGTTSVRCILFDRAGMPVSSAVSEVTQYFPKDGWVEQDGMEIWSSALSTMVEAMARVGAEAADIAALGITNQRETVLLWDRSTGFPVSRAIVWQCRRTADRCLALKAEGKEDMIREKTGLLLDPYFSATKLEWMLDNHPDLRRRAEEGELCFGTVDSFLIFKLTGGKSHVTDVSNASRTMLFDIRRLSWDEELCSLFRIPTALLPEICPSSGRIAETDAAFFGGSIPISGVAGDQQAALFGQGCFETGTVKNTYGTGGFLLMNTGDVPVFSENGLLTTVAWQREGRTVYALEGSVFICGAAIQWLRDGMRILESAKDSEYMARKVPDSDGLFVVPAFSGLGAPYWDPYARGMIIGITRATNKYHLIRATLESMAYQTADLLSTMEAQTGKTVECLRVDGGASDNGLLLSFQADILGIPVERPLCVESTARGAAFLAGLAEGFWQQEELLRLVKEGKTFSPQQDEAWRASHRQDWHRAVERTVGWKNV